MANELQGKTVIMMMANEGVEEVEFTRPRQALMDAGATVHIAAPEVGKIQMMNHTDMGDVVESDMAIRDIKMDQMDALMMPGGAVNPDTLRMDTDAVAVVRQAWDRGLPIAAICHAPWMLVEAGIVDGQTLTSWPSLQTDIRNAGGEWVDQEVVGGKGLVTSRNPDDLDAFCDKMIEEIMEGNHASKR